MIITIDGPIATGKSTIAKKLAEELGYIYIDTGAMYRVVTYGIFKKGIDYQNTAQLEEFLDHFPYNVTMKKGVRHYFFEDEDVTDKIRGEEVTKKVSTISAIKIVRDKLVTLQRRVAQGVNAVCEGRDMGTVVFPNAQIKVFLTGREDVRAKRRFNELRAKFPNETKDLTIEKTIEDIKKRDDFDMTRENSPLKQAEDAFVLDTSDLTIDEIVFRILEYKDTKKIRPKS